MDKKSNPHSRVINWLYFTAFMVFAMAVIGAITRLTESGLSMVEWRPLIGALPPLSEAEWNRVFDLYKQTPEFIHKNSWMTLADFQKIFFWEWLHRVWGRLIGLVYVLPLLWFWIKGQIPHGYKGALLFILALGAGQSVMGWYMVMSGLVDRPDVSHFRLAAHLSLAFVIYACVLWVAFSLRKTGNTPASFCLLRHGWIALALVSVTVIWGAFVAGLNGGLVYNTWPMMDAHWIPPEVTGLYAILHDPAAVQFTHRWIAVIAALAALSFAWRIKSAPIAAMMIVQIGLGIATVLTQVHIPLAAAHQAGAMILIGLFIYELNRRKLSSRATCPP